MSRGSSYGDWLKAHLSHSAVTSQPRSSARRSASVRLRAPVFWMQADR